MLISAHRKNRDMLFNIDISHLSLPNGDATFLIYLLNILLWYIDNNFIGQSLCLDPLLN